MIDTLRLLFEQSTSENNLDYFIQLNESLFKYTKVSKSESFYKAIEETARNKMDGLSPLDWVKNQPYSDIKIPSGYNFKLLVTRGGFIHSNITKNPARIYFILFQRDSENYRDDVSGAKFDISIFDNQGKVIKEDTLSIDQDRFNKGYPTFYEIPDGLDKSKYTVKATAAVNGRKLYTEIIFEIK